MNDNNCKSCVHFQVCIILTKAGELPDLVTRHGFFEKDYEIDYKIASFLPSICRQYKK